jgi:nucleoside-diphosphate-sugar epimerase
LLAGLPKLTLGSTSPLRDFVFVADTVDGFLRVADSPNCVGKVTNIGTGSAVTIGKVAELAMEITGRRVPVVTDDDRVRPKTSEVLALICDASAAAERCGWKPNVTLDQGLLRTAEFISGQLRRLRPGEYSV